MLVFVVLGISCISTIPLYNNYKANVFSTVKTSDVKYELPLFYKFPGFDVIDHFILCTMYSIYISGNCAAYISSIDLFLILIMFQIVAHLRALKGSLNNLSKLNGSSEIETDSVKMFTNEENNIIHLRLKAVIDHHRFIVM